MSALFLCACLALGARLAQSGEEQVLFVELVAQGPLEAVLVGGGETGDERESGALRVEGPLRAGERRTLLLPLPLALALPASLARETLAERLPTVRLLGAGAGAAARVVGLADPQPAQALERLPPGLRGRPRPAPPDSRAEPRWAALAAVVLALCASLAARRRPLALSLAALAGALLAFFSAGSARALPTEVRVLEADLASARCLEVRAARDEIGLGFDGLAVEPASTRLAIRCDFEGRGSVRAPGALLVARRVVSLSGPLDPAHNGWEDFEALWVRDSGGRWTFHGPWSRSSALPPERAGPALPGWLAAGVPPGVGVLVGRLREPGVGWVRATGFQAP